MTITTAPPGAPGRTGTLVLASLGSFLAALDVVSLIGALFFITQLFQIGLGYSPLEAGLRILVWVAILAAVFAANGGYSTTGTFLAGLRPALPRPHRRARPPSRPAGRLGPAATPPVVTRSPGRPRPAVIPPVATPLSRPSLPLDAATRPPPRRPAVGPPTAQHRQDPPSPERPPR